MRIPKSEILDYSEYTVTIDYDGKGGIEISVLDELGDEIEGIYISNAEDDIDNFNEDDFDINLN